MPNAWLNRLVQRSDNKKDENRLMAKEQPNRNDYMNQYRKDNEIRFNIAFRKERDADVIDFIKSAPNRTELFCRLVRQEMERQVNKQAKVEN